MAEFQQLIVGDVEAMTEVTVNTKGGSMTATLKKALRERLGSLAGGLAGAAVQFTTGQAVVLLSPGGEGAGGQVRVYRIGKNRFEIELDTGEDEEVDDVTAAFLQIKRSQFIKGELELLPPVSAAQRRAESDARLEPGRRAIAALKAAAKTAAD